MQNDLSIRMKQNYENVFKHKLPERMPVIIRLDGRAFHTLTRGSEKPFDLSFINLMNETALYLCKEIQNVQIAYVQSDEISLLLHNYKRLNSQSWFDNEIQKMCSISAGLTTAKFNRDYSFNIIKNFLKNEDETIDCDSIPLAQFDSRCFVIPEDEVCNYFIWR